MIADEKGAAAPQTQRRRRLRRLALLGSALLALTSPVWGPPLLANLDFFRVRRVEVTGARYANPNEIVSRLRIDSTASVWDKVEPLEELARQHPSVREVRIKRRLPGTLVVEVTENPPVALVQVAGGLVAVDETGRTLPVDPTAVDVDLPVLRTRDVVSLKLLGDVREALPGLFARIGDVRRTGGELAIRLNEPAASGVVLVLVQSTLSVERLSEIIPVEADLARRKLQPTELDLRYKDQVVVRLP